MSCRFAANGAAAVLGWLLACAGVAEAEVWRVVYAMDETRIEIRDTPFGVGDGSYLVGPGFLTIDFTASNGVLTEGPVKLVDLTLVEDFTAVNGGANVDANLYSRSSFGGAQTSVSGILVSNTITWSEKIPFKTEGTNTCTGQFCGFAGFEEGVPQDAGGEAPITLAPFEFGSGGPQGGADFDGGEVLLSAKPSSNTYLLPLGREIRRNLIASDALDPCLPYPKFGVHSGDLNCDQSLQLTELLRIVQLFNAGQYHCQVGTEDNYQTGPGTTGACRQHSADFSAPNFRLDLSELLRAIQLFNVGNFIPCPAVKDGDEGFCTA